MAGGNYLPYPTDVDVKMVYAEFPPYEDDDQWECEWEEIKHVIGDALPKSFCDADTWVHHYLHVFFEILDSAGDLGATERAADRLDLIGVLLQVGIADNEWSWAIVVRPVLDRDTDQPEYPGLAYRHIDSVFNRIAAALSSHGYELYQRTGAWTSAKMEDVT